MSRRRLLHRFLTPILVVVSLLFSQLALANYVCPAASVVDTMAEMMASGAPCEGMDTEAPQLCHQMSADAGQSAEMPKLLTPSLPAIVHVLVLPIQHDSASALSLPFSDRPEVRPAPGPIFLQTLRLRV